MPTTLVIEVHLILYVSNQELEIMIGFVVVILHTNNNKRQQNKVQLMH